VPEVVAGSAVETPEIAEKIDSPVEPEPVEEAVVPVETVASEEVNEERVEVIKTAGPAESSAMKYFIAIVALVVLLCAGTVAYLYYPDCQPKLKNICISYGIYSSAWRPDGSPA
jgi:hypothetical protein